MTATRISKTLLFALVASIGLSGCATMNSDECLTVDWSTIGYEDGAMGYGPERLGQHRKACAKHGVAPDFSAYQDGRERGLQDYCQPSRGFNVGANGGSYNGVCSAHYEGDFLDAFNSGRHLYTLRSNVNRANAEINSRKNELERIDVATRDTEAGLISRETSTEDRVLLLVDLKDFSERRGQIEAEIDALYDERARSEVELEHYQSQLANLGY